MRCTLALLAAAAADPNTCFDNSQELRFGTEQYQATYEWVCCNNKRWAEHRGFADQINFYHGDEELLAAKAANEPLTYYDPKCGVPLFVAPVGRTWDEYIKESEKHGWPSFRDEEVVTENVIVVEHGEVVSSCGTHLGHNLPDGRNRYCINLICAAGAVPADASTQNVTLGIDPEMEVKVSDDSAMLSESEAEPDASGTDSDTGASVLAGTALTAALLAW